MTLIKASPLFDFEDFCVRRLPHFWRVFRNPKDRLFIVMAFVVASENWQAVSSGHCVFSIASTQNGIIGYLFDTYKLAWRILVSEHHNGPTVRGLRFVVVGSGGGSSAALVLGERDFMRIIHAE